MSTERELLEKAFFAKFPAFRGELTPGDTAIKRSWLEIFEAGWQAAKSSASTDAVLPELPEPYSAASSIKCVACGEQYKPTAANLPRLPWTTPCSFACRCGSTSWQGNYREGPSPAQFTADQMHTYARAAIALNRGEDAQDLLALRRFADAVIGGFPEHGDIDGVTLEEIAESCGLLKQERKTVPCCETCACVACGVQGKTFCFQVQPVLIRARRVAAIHAAAIDKAVGGKDGGVCPHRAKNQS